MSYSSTDVVNECQISRLTDSSDSFGDNTSYKLPSAIKHHIQSETVTVKQHYPNNKVFLPKQQFALVY